jgi:hypothetical protein
LNFDRELLINDFLKKNSSKDILTIEETVKEEYIITEEEKAKLTENEILELEKKNRVFIVMEKCEEGDLFDFMIINKKY